MSHVAGSYSALDSIAVGLETVPQTPPHADAGSGQQAGTKQINNM